MPAATSVLNAIKRLHHFAAVNINRPDREQLEALDTLHRSLGLDDDSLSLIVELVSSTKFCPDVSAKEAFALITYGMSLALTAVQLEQESAAVDLAA